MGWFSKKKDPEMDDMQKLLDKRSNRFVALCDDFNRKFHPGDFIRYWYGNSKDWDSSFGFIVEMAGCEESIVSMNIIRDVWFRLLRFTLYGKSEPDILPDIVHINDDFHAEKSSQEEFIEYKKMRIQASIDDAKENIKRLRESIKRQNTERNNINDFLKANWLIVTENLKKHIKK